MNIKWDAKGYTDNFAFVHHYGEDVLGLVDAEKGSFIVDLGCGNGALTEKIKDMGYRVLGVDGSPEMVENAKKLHPELEFVVGDATEFTLFEKADVIFSNAVFHWIDTDKQEKLVANIAAQLKPGGELVCEFGGYGCAEAIHSVLEHSFEKRGIPYPRTFYFPTIGEYAPILERAGLRVDYAVLFDRPTPQKTEDGAADWIRMFVKTPFIGMEPEKAEEIIRETADELKSTLYHDGTWFVDYVRIRIRARKVSEE